MKKLHFPETFKHEHPPIQNVNKIFEEQLTHGQRAADWVANNIGSWRFIIGQTFLLIIWAILNVTAYIKHWDPYPFILMNLVLSMQAAYTAPMIMMSQNRQEAKDRLESHIDYLVNQKAEEEIRIIMDHLTAQDEALKEIHRMLVEPVNHEQ
jgi:uncharacterized membrane protein